MLIDKARALQGRAPKRLGRDYACVVVTPPRAPEQGGSDSGHRLLLFVTSRSAIRPAKRLLRQVRAPEGSRAKLTSKRYGAPAIGRIGGEMHKTMPRDGRSELGGEPIFNRSSCPRVLALLLPEGEASPQAERWAAEAVRRFGADRVGIARGYIFPA